MNDTGEDVDPKANVLIVDDRSENRLAFREVLEGLGERLVLVDSGQDALRFLLHHDAAVVLLDVQMPGIDGFETAEMIRGRDRTHNTPIMFVTGLSHDLSDVRRGYAIGAVDYIFQPVRPEILRAKVSVFVELYRYRTEQVMRLEQELEAERTAIEALRVRAPTSPGPIDGGASVKKAIQMEYREIVAGFVASGSEDGAVHERLKGLARRIGASKGGARDVMDLHVAVARHLDRKLPPSRARQLRVRCRTIALELMGHLVEYFRVERLRDDEES